MERFPAPGHIRKAIPTRQEFAGLPALIYPPVSQEERDQAIADTREVVKRLKGMFAAAGKKLKVPITVGQLQPARSIAEQKEILRRKGFLK